MTRLEVINRALMKTGLPLADNLKDLEWDATVVFEGIAVELLRCHSWNFARKFATLQRSAERPPFGFDYAYVKPADCLRVVDVRSSNDLRSPRARFVDQGVEIYTNASPCNTRYIYRQLDPDKWAPDFTDAVAGRIAAEIAAKAAQRMDLVPQLAQLAQILLEQAKVNDGKEYFGRVPAENAFTDARADR